MTDETTHVELQQATPLAQSQQVLRRIRRRIGAALAKHHASSQRVARAAASARSSVPPGRPLLILLVEDDLGMADALERELSSEGSVVHVATTLQSAWRLAQMNRYDVILLDLNLPDGPGEDLARHRRSRGDTTPIVVLTATTLSDAIERTRGLDTEIMLKDFEPGTLGHTLRRMSGA